VQTNVEFANCQANLNRMLEWLRDSRLVSADLVVFPECMLSGYCFDSLEEAIPHAQSIPGKATHEIHEHCRRTGQFVAFGMLETGESGNIYNTCVLMGPHGMVAKYRKIHLPGLGVDRFTTSGGNPFRVHDANEMRVGIHICYDGVFPESGRVMAMDGADLLILPTNWPPGADTFAKYIPNARALENNVYFLAVNRVGIERGFRFIGQSRLCDTNGNVISEAGPFNTSLNTPTNTEPITLATGTAATNVHSVGKTTPEASAYGSGQDAEAIVIGRIDLERARNKCLVRVPGQHVIDRWADRHPEHYGRILEPPS
jgi:predicted amidohydrolase